MQTVEMVKKHKPLNNNNNNKRSVLGMILFSRENETWKLKGTANFKKKITGQYYSPVSLLF